MTRKRRHLSKEERDIWQRVAESTNPINRPKPVQTEPVVKPAPEPKRPYRADPFRIASKVDHKSDHDLIPSLNLQIAAEPKQMDKKAFTKLKRGRLSPEARIDLHGMTLAQAHPALSAFILDSAARGLRLVLVITGKGKDRDDGNPIPTRLGVLRHQVPQWLRMAPLGPIVMQITEAHVKHGGQGAYYVYLRRRR